MTKAARTPSPTSNHFGTGTRQSFLARRTSDDLPSRPRGSVPSGSVISHHVISVICRCARRNDAGSANPQDLCERDARRPTARRSTAAPRRCVPSFV